MPRRVVIVALPEVQPLDVTGPAEVLASAASVAGGDDAAYTIEVVAPGGAPIPTDSGYAIAPAGALEAVHGPIDTLLVAGGAGARHASAETVARVRRLAARADRVASVCTGAYVLAAAGLLDGRRATTHWSWCDDLQRRHPAVTVERDPIFVVDGPVRTSAGVTAGMDLALALVEEDLGPRVALDRDGGMAALEVVAPAPVGRRAAAVQQAGGGEHVRARAHRRDAVGARREPPDARDRLGRRVARARAAGDEQRVDRPADGLERPGRGDRVAGVRRDRRAAGRDDLDRVRRDVPARDGRGRREDLGRPGDVERLDLGQGDDDDAAGHGARRIARGGRGSKDR